MRLSSVSERVDIQSLLHARASYYISIMVFLSFDNVNISLICLLSIMRGQLML